MGACSIYVTARGMSIREAFDNAVEEANEEYGHGQGYSGAINNCRLVKEVSKGSYTEEEILDRTDKREVWGYCSQAPVKNNNKIKSVVENFPQKGTRKWKTVYQVTTNYSSEVLIQKDSQTAAIKAAREYVEKNPQHSLQVSIAKILVEGNTRCAAIKYKQANKERQGTYVFIGMAPE